MFQEIGEHDIGHHFALCREKGDATTVATFCLVTNLCVSGPTDLLSLRLRMAVIG